MLRHHLTVITRDNRLKREVQRVTAATASTADFGPDLALLAGDRKPDLVIVDARTEAPPAGLKQKLPDGAQVVYVLDEERLLDGLTYFDDARVTSIMGHGARFDDDEFIASATKALRGNVFGLNKYFPWGVTTYSVVVKNYEQKNKAIDVILRYANLAGVRGPVRDRIQTVADELMMNGLYHAPVDKDGKELYRDRTIKDLAQLDEVSPIEVQYGSSGRYFGISVRDGGGSLTRQRAMQYLSKARAGTADVEKKVGGAGLGLVSVLRSVSKLIINLDPGSSTEVIGLFDMELFAKGKVGARSVHLFTSRGLPEPEVEDEPAPEAPPPVEAPPPAKAASRAGVWILAAILLSVVTAMATAVVIKKTSKAKAPAELKCPPPSTTPAPGPSTGVTPGPGASR
ncbi:MAG: hypothetical protein H6709_10635 [Kofleriaceae bacterium]|nr:hypothetical protein [Myxococcales bacterium]MCB9564101.1 hypothetical protein [Kofleriaceae bacterium]MCB9572531.1 hypothetical protein [Kofleriaceae bacterium]